jgi:hypothetical protein
MPRYYHVRRHPGVISDSARRVGLAAPSDAHALQRARVIASLVAVPDRGVASDRRRAGAA